MPSSTPSIAFLAFLTAGHPGGRADAGSRGEMAFLRTLATHSGIDPSEAHGGVSLLAAWLGNRPAGLSGEARPGSDAIEAIGLALLDLGADGLAGLADWAHGRGGPRRDTTPADWTETALLAGANPCPMASAFVNGQARLLERMLAGLPEAGRGALLDSLRCADGSPLLHAAIDCPAVLAVLLQAGADPNIVHPLGNGARPLHAVHDAGAAGLLMQHGADCLLRDGNGRTCAQVWQGRFPKNILAPLLAALPVKARRGSVRDRAFRGDWAGTRASVEMRLRKEGCEVPLADLVWTGVAACALGLQGERGVPSPATLSRMRRDRMGDGRALWLRQCCLILAAAGGQWDNPPDHAATTRVLDEAGYDWLKYREQGPRLARKAFAGEVDGLFGGLEARMDRLSMALGEECLAQEPEAVRRLVFDTTGSALLAIGGCDGRAMQWLAACSNRWPGITASEFLQGWTQKRSFLREGMARQALMPGQAMAAALAVRGLKTPDASNNTAHVDNSKNILWSGILDDLQGWDGAAWEAAGDGLVKVVSAGLREMPEVYAKALDGTLQALLARRRLLGNGAAGATMRRRA